MISKSGEKSNYGKQVKNPRKEIGHLLGVMKAQDLAKNVYDAINTRRKAFGFEEPK